MNGKEQAEKHWTYSDTFYNFLEQLPKVVQCYKEPIAKFYKAVFEHGYKHGYKHGYADARKEFEIPRATNGKFQKKD